MSSDSKPVTISPTTASQPLNANLTNSLYAALLSSSGIPNIQATLTHELQASGWTSNLRSYITQLLRSGECTSYKEVLDRILEEANVEGLDAQSNGTGVTNGVNGHKENGVSGSGEGKSVEEGGIRIPHRAVREGVRVVRRELEKVCDIAVEGEEKY